MKKMIAIVGLITFIGFNFISCNKDDNNNIDYSKKVKNTTWLSHDIITQDGKKYDAILKITFQNNNKGNLNTKSTVKDKNFSLDITYNFDYTMSSYQSGTIKFEDPELGNQNFNVSDNYLTLNNREYVKQTKDNK